MQIIAHRGLWESEVEKNSLNAFNKSLQNGFGIETDLRDFTIKLHKSPPPPRQSVENNTNNKIQLAISHDVPNADALNAREFFTLYKNLDSTLPLALNIKSDGLQTPLKELLCEFNIKNYFVFDASVPDTLGYLNAGFQIFTRQSEYEQTPSFYDKACGIWLDEFHTHWINKSAIISHLERGKKICIVSPELHKRDYKKEWMEYKEILTTLPNSFRQNIMICTDFPQLAREFFND